MNEIKENITEKLARLQSEFNSRIASGEIKTHGKNEHGFDIVIKAGTKLCLKKNKSITAVAAEDCCLGARIKYTAPWTDRGFKKGDYETFHTYTILNIFDFV